MDPSEITPVAQDYLKAIWSATEWGDPPITTSALAARFNTSAPNVTDTIKRLAAQGLVEHRPYKPVRLTPSGRAYAVAMVRRHRLLETFLVSMLGYSWDQVHDESEQLEHAASDMLIERIDALLEHPRQDPHGDPIPTADGRTHLPEGTLRLTDAPPGNYRIVRVSDTDPALLQVLDLEGLLPGSPLRVVDGEGTFVVTDQGQHTLALSRADSAAIRVGPMDPVS